MTLLCSKILVKEMLKAIILENQAEIDGINPRSRERLTLVSKVLPS